LAQTAGEGSEQYHSRCAGSFGVEIFRDPVRGNNKKIVRGTARSLRAISSCRKGGFRVEMWAPIVKKARIYEFE
jgi:hypothetical protein